MANEIPIKIITLNDVYVVGVHSGFANFGIMTINGGYFASPNHGGGYNSATLYANGACFENVKYSGECTDLAEISKIIHYGAMYNGSSNVNAVAYLNNCKFINNEATYGIVVTTNYEHLSPSVYLSNCDIKDLRVDGERVDNPGQFGTAYIGKNVTYNLESMSYGDGVVDETTYANVVFNTEWLKAQGIIE